MTVAEMGSVLDQLVRLSAIVYKNEAHWNVTGMELIPGATDEKIEALSASCSFPFPPSYRQFLRLTNGCFNFWPKFTLLGTEGEPYEIVRAEIEDAHEHQSQFVKDASGQITPESLAAFESKKGSRYFFVPTHTVFGTNKGGEFFLFNEKVRTAEGEYEAVRYSYSAAAKERYPDFPSLLLSTAQRLEERIASKGYAQK